MKASELMELRKIHATLESVGEGMLKCYLTPELALFYDTIDEFGGYIERAAKQGRVAEVTVRARKRKGKKG